jgi:hypothetical protein
MAKKLYTFRLSDGTLALLDQMAQWTGIENRTEMLEYCIASMHALLASGLYKTLPPMPEIARIALEKKRLKKSVQSVP